MAADRNLNQAVAQIERARADKCLRPSIAGFFDEATNTVSYVVHDPKTDEAAIIDSVLDFEAASGRTSNGSADRVIEYITSNNLKVMWLIETHAHADHISAAPYLQERLGGKLAIGRDIIRVQEVFGKLFNAGTDFERDGSQFDKLFDDGETFRSENWKASPFTFPATRLPTWPSSSAMRPLSATRSSCRTSGRRGPTFRAATRTSCFARSVACSRCRTKRACSCAMTTRRRAATNMPGRPPSNSSAKRMCM